MGCWSESCALSGVEIRHDERTYAALIRDEGESLTPRFITPLIEGTYDDYGGIDLTEVNEQFGLQKGEHWSLTRCEETETLGSIPVYFDAEMVDSLVNLDLTFPFVWSRNERFQVETRSEKYDIILEGMRQDIETMITDRTTGEIRLYSFDWNNTNFHSSLLAYVIEQVHQGKENFDNFLMAYRRTLILVDGLFSLRKGIAPNIMGPQHGGQEMLNAFLRMTMERNNKLLEYHD